MFVAPAPSIQELMAKLDNDATLAALTAPAETPTRDRYLHWDKMRHLEPPAGLSNEQWWLKTKLARGGEMRRLPLVDPEGNAFGYTLPDVVLRHLHRIDQRRAGEVAMDEVVTSERAEREAGNRFLVNSLHLYLQRKMAEQHDVEQHDHEYTFGGHARSHRVTHETARADLGGLVKRGLLARRRSGRAYRFGPASDLPERLRESAP